MLLAIHRDEILPRSLDTYEIIAKGRILLFHIFDIRIPHGILVDFDKIGLSVIRQIWRT